MGREAGGRGRGRWGGEVGQMEEERGMLVVRHASEFTLIFVLFLE